MWFIKAITWSQSYNFLLHYYSASVVVGLHRSFFMVKRKYFCFKKHYSTNGVVTRDRMIGARHPWRSTYNFLSVQAKTIPLHRPRRPVDRGFVRADLSSVSLCTRNPKQFLCMISHLASGSTGFGPDTLNSEISSHWPILNRPSPVLKMLGLANNFRILYNNGRNNCSQRMLITRTP
jgi:hypothetical protein